MKYWAYVNNEVQGPFEKEQLAKLPNFTASSLICPETQAGGEANGWKEASTFPEVSAIVTLPALAPSKSQYPPSESPLALTMRGSLISDPVVTDPAAEPPAGTPAAFSLAPINVLKPDAIEPPEETPKPAVPDKTPAASENIPTLPGQDPRLEPLKLKVEEMGAALVSIRKSQTQLLDEVSRLESAVAEIKMLLSSEPPKK